MKTQKSSGKDLEAHSKWVRPRSKNKEYGMRTKWEPKKLLALRNVCLPLHEGTKMDEIIASRLKNDNFFFFPRQHYNPAHKVLFR